MVKAIGIIVALVILGGAAQAQQISVNPTGVNVNAHGATTVFPHLWSDQGLRASRGMLGGRVDTGHS